MAPAHTKVLIIGGGPGGSYAASCLAREGIQATLLEASKFPRYHIGESMLPSLKPFLKFIGAEEKVLKHGFAVKPGAAVKFNQYKREGYTDFIKNDPNNGSFNVIRSEFDEILLRHAQEVGAEVLEEHKVTAIHFEDDKPSGRPIAATFVGPDGEGKITFDFLVDASGRNGIMSTKYLHNRKMNTSLKNIACWGYFSGDRGMYKPGTGRENAPWFESLTDESGWSWFIPLHNGTTSVGVVIDQESSNAKKAALRARNPDSTLRDHYMEQLEFVPGVKNLIHNGTLVDNLVKSATDFSYSPERYSGDHYRLVGDAAAFIDPFFSSGVHLAILGGLNASITITASINGQVTEQVAADFHNIKSSTAYTRFMIVVMSAYKQIRSQNIDLLSDVDSDNFDRAFDLLRPVIQGTADVGKKVTDDELQKTMDFCQNIFAPADNEITEQVAGRVPAELLSIAAPIFSPGDLEKLIDPNDTDAIAVVNRVNTAKALAPMYVTGPLENEPVHGLIVNLETGKLGLKSI